MTRSTTASAGVALLSGALALAITGSATSADQGGSATSVRGSSAASPRYLDPAWSPDGKRIAFVKQAPYPSVKSAIYVMNRDGTGLRRLTGTRDAVASPTWSPDGLRIAFSDANGIHLMKSNGRGVRSIGAAIGRFGKVEWGPGGRKIAFEVTGMNFLDRTVIYVVNPDGSDQRVAADPSNTAEQDAYRRPTWSPDGQRLLFAVAQIDDAALTGSVRSFLGVIDSFAGPVRDLLNGDYAWYPNPHHVPLDGRGWDPDWSPDGRRIAMGGGVLTLRPHRFRILHEGGFSPDWSPDGRKIVFVKRADPPGANERIYVMNANGSNLRLLTPDLRR